MRKYSIIMMAFALLLGMAQCKKEPTNTNNGNTERVDITLKVDNGNNGDRLNVYPATGAVIFTQGDEIYVGNNGKYVGTLTFENGLFQGTIDGDFSTNDFLHFYFVGNKPTSPTELTAGTTSYTVDISDQSTGLPAISYAPSTAKYSPTTTAYTAKLLNKSALVKFVPSLSTSQPITVSGLNNEVQIDFANHTLAPTGNTDGGITLYSVSDTEKWAVLLAQDAVSNATVTISGYAATASVPPITNNMYYNSGVGISMTATYQTFVVTSSSSDPSVSSFNAAASTPTPKLFFNTNYGDGLTLTRANGIVDFNGHSANELFIQNDVEGESITLQNGTIGDKPIDGASGTGTFFKGTVIMENMTVNGLIYTDGHAFIINSGTYNQKICCDTYSGYPGTTTIYGGYFTELGFNSGPQGTYILYGGKYKNRPNDAWCAAGYTIISNQDDDKVTYPWVVTALPEGALRGEFTINGSGGKVFFSKGNLKYSNGTWSFHEQQYDCCFTSNGDVTSYYTSTGTFDLFCWGTSGYNHGANCYHPWSTIQNSSDYYAYGGNTYHLYDQSGQADWGYNPISNGGNQANQWRTLTRPEWDYVFNTRTTSSGFRYAKANVNNVNGVILLPDDWSSDTYSFTNTDNASCFSSNVITTSQWNTLEQAGAVFLPAAGYRLGTSVGSNVGSGGYYWSASRDDSNSAYNVRFFDSGLDPQTRSYRYAGHSVRLVRNVQ